MTASDRGAHRFATIGVLAVVLFLVLGAGLSLLVQAVIA